MYASIPSFGFPYMKLLFSGPVLLCFQGDITTTKLPQPEVVVLGILKWNRRQTVLYAKLFPTLLVSSLTRPDLFFGWRHSIQLHMPCLPAGESFVSGVAGSEDWRLANIVIPLDNQPKRASTLSQPRKSYRKTPPYLRNYTSPSHSSIDASSSSYRHTEPREEYTCLVEIYAHRAPLFPVF